MQKAIIITAPSGAGKTTLVKKLLEAREDLAFSISACTREKRANEVHGMDYYFLIPEVFKKMIANGEFMEWEEVYENMFYGTLKSEIERIWGENKAVIFDIDVKGALSLKKELGDQALSLFIVPPSIEVLKERLRNRGTESDESFQKRLNKSIDELNFKDQMDDVILNDNLEDAILTLKAKVGDFLA
jgi:guanylate kinase